MPRNEFKAGDEEGEIREVILLYNGSGLPYAKIENGILTPLKNHPGKGEDEDLNQEESPVEENPDRMDAVVSGLKALADLRKEPGLTTTEAHRKTRPVLPPED